MKKVAGFGLIFLGVATALCLLAWCIHSSYLHWQTIDSFKAEEFSDFWKYYWNFCKRDFIGSLVIGAVPTGIGACLLRIPYSTCLLVISCLIWTGNVVCTVLSYWMPQMLDASFVLLALIMIEWVFMFFLNSKNGLDHALVRKETPKLFVVLGGVSLLYTLCNGIVSLIILREGGPEIADGVYCLWNHGFIREITKEEYDYLSLVEARFAAGHILAFAAAPMLVFSTIRERKRLQKNADST